MDTTIDTPLLDEGARDDTVVVMPALRKLLLLASAQDTDQQVEAVVEISKLVKRRRVDLSSFDPLCHILTRLVASDHQPVVAYAARSINSLVLDDTLRPEAARAGIPSVLAAALIRRQGDTECLREVLGALQALCFDERTVVEVIDVGALGSVLELLDTEEPELISLLMATLANILSFSDTLLRSREECIDAICDRIDIVLDAIKNIKRHRNLGNFALAALANGCAHPVIAGRAKELGAPDVLIPLILNECDHRFVRAFMGRLNRPGDIEQGAHGGHDEWSGYPLEAFRFKSGMSLPGDAAAYAKLICAAALWFLYCIRVYL